MVTKKAILPNEHDCKMIDFLWHHRVASFRTLHRLFYSHFIRRVVFGEAHIKVGETYVKVFLLNQKDELSNALQLLKDYP